MKTKPLNLIPELNHVYLSCDKPTAGSLDTSSRSAAIEVGEVIAVGEDVKRYKKGDKIIFKSWAVDICNIDGKDYYFIDLDTHGIKATIK